LDKDICFQDNLLSDKIGAEINYSGNGEILIKDAGKYGLEGILDKS
jgi:hypothetical protein